MEPPPQYRVSLASDPLAPFNLVVIGANVALRRDQKTFWKFESRGAQGYLIRPPRVKMALSLAPVANDVPPVDWANAMLHPPIRGESQQWRIIGLPGSNKFLLQNVRYDTFYLAANDNPNHNHDENAEINVGVLRIPDINNPPPAFKWDISPLTEDERNEEMEANQAAAVGAAADEAEQNA